MNYMYVYDYGQVVADMIFANDYRQLTNPNNVNW